MSSNYQPSGTPGQLIATGVANCAVTPAAGSADANLLNQQVDYAARCNAFIAAALAVRNGVDATNQKQVFLLNIMNSTFMTLAIAQTYFAGATATFWATSGIIDYKGALAAMQAATF